MRRSLGAARSLANWAPVLVLGNGAAGAEKQAIALADALANERRARPTDDVVSRIVTGEVDGEPLSPQETRTMFVLLVIAGNETTRTVTCWGMHSLITHPDQREKVLRDPALLDWSTGLDLSAWLLGAAVFSPPVEGDGLWCSVDTPSTDPEGDPIAYTTEVVTRLVPALHEIGA